MLPTAQHRVCATLRQMRHCHLNTVFEFVRCSAFVVRGGKNKSIQTIVDCFIIRVAHCTFAERWAKFISGANWHFGPIENKSHKWWQNIFLSVHNICYLISVQRLSISVSHAKNFLTTRIEHNSTKPNVTAFALYLFSEEFHLPIKIVRHSNGVDVVSFGCHKSPVNLQWSGVWAGSLLQLPATSSILTAWTLISSIKIANVDLSLIRRKRRAEEKRNTFAAFILFERPSRFNLYSMWWWWWIECNKNMSVCLLFAQKTHECRYFFFSFSRRVVIPFFVIHQTNGRNEREPNQSQWMRCSQICRRPTITIAIIEFYRLDSVAQKKTFACAAPTHEHHAIAVRPRKKLPITYAAPCPRNVFRVIYFHLWRWINIYQTASELQFIYVFSGSRHIGRAPNTSDQIPHDHRSI